VEEVELSRIDSISHQTKVSLSSDEGHTHYFSSILFSSFFLLLFIYRIWQMEGYHTSATLWEYEGHGKGDILGHHHATQSAGWWYAQVVVDAIGPPVSIGRYAHRALCATVWGWHWSCLSCVSHLVAWGRRLRFGPPGLFGRVCIPSRPGVVGCISLWAGGRVPFDRSGGEYLWECEGWIVRLTVALNTGVFTAHPRTTGDSTPKALMNCRE